MSEQDETPLSLPLSQYLGAQPLEAQRALIWARICARRAEAKSVPEAPTVPLPLPINTTLVDADQLSIPRARLFRQVRARVHRPRSRSAPRALLVGVALLGVVACLVIARQGMELLQGPAGGALICADGQPFKAIEAGPHGETVRLADDSEIRLSPGARIEPLLSSATRFELLLSRGSAELSVTPGGPRRWLVEAGAARVEVVGTVFRVVRTAERVDVSVSRGAVLVRGEHVPGWVKRLSAGQRLSVPTSPAPHADSQPAAQVAEAEAEAEPARDTPARVPEDAPRARPVSRRRQGSQALTPLFDPQADPHESYASLGPAGMARETMQATAIETLLELADIARLSGHPQDAVAPLTRALDNFRTSPQAGLAAFTLGRVLLEQLSAPAAAAEAFERAISLYLPRTLLSDCYRRLAEAYDRAGNQQARDQVAARFRAAFPNEAHDSQEAAPR